MHWNEATPLIATARTALICLFLGREQKVTDSSKSILCPALKEERVPAHVQKIPCVGRGSAERRVTAGLQPSR